MALTPARLFDSRGEQESLSLDMVAVLWLDAVRIIRNEKCMSGTNNHKESSVLCRPHLESL